MALNRAGRHRPGGWNDARKLLRMIPTMMRYCRKREIAPEGDGFPPSGAIQGPDIWGGHNRINTQGMWGQRFGPRIYSGNFRPDTTWVKVLSALWNECQIVEAIRAKIAREGLLRRSQIQGIPRPLIFNSHYHCTPIGLKCQIYQYYRIFLNLFLAQESGANPPEIDLGPPTHVEARSEHRPGPTSGHVYCPPIHPLKTVSIKHVEHNLPVSCVKKNVWPTTSLYRHSIQNNPTARWSRNHRPINII